MLVELTWKWFDPPIDTGESLLWADDLELQPGVYLLVRARNQTKSDLILVGDMNRFTGYCGCCAMGSHYLILAMSERIETVIPRREVD